MYCTKFGGFEHLMGVAYVVFGSLSGFKALCSSEYCVGVALLIDV